jgi:hypothetical protein
MRYMLLIYGDESQMASATEEQMGQMMEAYNKFTADFQASGKMLGGEALQPTPTATVVRVQDGKTVTTDGPYAETKEALGGYLRHRRRRPGRGHRLGRQNPRRTGRFY